MSVLSRFVHGAGKSDADALVESGALLRVQISVLPVLALSFEKAGRRIPAPIHGVALIDTGATRTGVAVCAGGPARAPHRSRGHTARRVRGPEDRIVVRRVV